MLYYQTGAYVFSPFHKEFTDFNSKVILDVPTSQRNPITQAEAQTSSGTFTGQYWGEAPGIWLSGI